jgi:hypothetical protein
MKKEQIEPGKTKKNISNTLETLSMTQLVGGAGIEVRTARRQPLAPFDKLETGFDASRRTVGY